MFQNNKANLLISILFAIGIWIYVTLAINPPDNRTITGVPVEIVNLEALADHGFTIDRSLSYMVDIEINGPRADIAKLVSSDFRAVADMTGYPKGVDAVTVSVSGPSGVEIITVKPQTINVEVVDRITVTKPVRLTYADTIPKNMEPGFVTVMPTELEVSGTAAAVDSIGYIMAEVPEGMLSEEPVTLTLEAVPITKSGSPEYYVSLSQNTIQVTVSLCTVKTVPLRVEMEGEAPEGLEITNMLVPDTITVRGSSSAVSDLEEVYAKSIDLTKLEETVEIPLEPYLPEGVEVADESQDLSVKIEVMGITQVVYEYTADMIGLDNLADGLSGHVNTGSVTVTVLVPEDVASDLSQDDIRLYVDASEIRKAADGVEMDVLFECEKELKSIVSDPARVRVTVISEKTQRTTTA